MTSGLGPSLGGVGVVAAGIVDALADANVSIWRHHPDRPRALRGLGLLTRAVLAMVRRPHFILFMHVDLARLMTIVPFLRVVPYGVFVHGVEVWQPLDRRRRAALAGATLVLANSSFTARKARAANPWLTDVRVVWLGTGEPVVAARRDRQRVVLVLGRMAAGERYKGHDAVLDAWPRVVACSPGARLVIVGDGDDRPRLEARAAGECSITFTGFVDKDAKAALLRSASAMVALSTGEGFGLAALEAAASGVPVIALKGTVSEELFPIGAGHVFLDSAAPQPLAAALTELLQDASLANRLGEEGQCRVRETFTTRHFSRRIRAALCPMIGDVAATSSVA